MLNREAFQKECKKYGVSIGLLEYAPQATEKIRRSLKPLIDHFGMFPLLQKEGKEYYLLADTPYVLKELRYRSPLLQTFDTQISVYGQQGSHRYGISYRMPCVVGDCRKYRLENRQAMEEGAEIQIRSQSNLSKGR